MKNNKFESEINNNSEGLSDYTEPTDDFYDIPDMENEDDVNNAGIPHRNISLYDGISLPDEEAMPNVDDDKIIRGDGMIEGERWGDFDDTAQNKPSEKGFIRSLFDIVEMLAAVSVVIILCFSFVVRLNKVDGPSMENTLHTNEFLAVSDLLYTPTKGDIVVIHDMTAGVYSKPIVKRIIATEGDTVDIDFSTWQVKVNGEIIDESEYVYLSRSTSYTSEISFPITVDEGCVFVMGDNRYNSADSRVEAIGQIDERCVVGKVYARLFPLKTFTIFKNPYND